MCTRPTRCPSPRAGLSSLSPVVWRPPSGCPPPVRLGRSYLACRALVARSTLPRSVLWSPLP
eukprot:1393045-Alexandrium_andersonii.AAC.1